MAMHSTDAFPLVPKPNIEQYKKQAKELAAAVKSGDRGRIEAWGLAFYEANSKHEKDHFLIHRRNEALAKAFADYWLGEDKGLRRDFPPAKPTLAHAQYILARHYGFPSWAAMVHHVDELNRADTNVARFEAAVDAIVTGDIETLRSLLREHPELIRARSTRGHGATLLHYVAANGTEGYRQKTPPNIVDITKLLLDAGADVNATAHCYGENDDVIGLTATSAHPQNAGVMIPLLETLVAAGSNVDRDGQIVHACIANGQPAAARWLVERGAAYGLPEAAGIGRLDLVQSFVAADGALRNGATRGQLEEAFRNACWYGESDVVRYLVDAGFEINTRFRDGSTALHHAANDGNLPVVELLLSRGSEVNVRDTKWNGNALDWALWAWGADGLHRDEPERYYRIVAMLRRAGEEIKDAWYANEGGRHVMERAARDQRMQAALRGEG